ncbi:MAG: L,D-transpeptidase family protein [Mycobacteriales bacterium]|nr:L,D-transpeptidase family protein [Mycobacteriales bacterium]
MPLSTLTRAALVGAVAGALLTAGAVPARAASPTLSGLAPTSARPGATVTLTGTDLAGATAVSLGSAPMAFTVVDATSLTAIVPTGAVTASVSVTTPEGTAPGPVLTVVPPPATPSVTGRAGRGTVELRLTGPGSAGVVVRALAGTTPPATTTEGRALTGAALVTDTGLTDGTPVSYSVWAVDTDGTTSASPATTTLTPGPPAPTTLRIAPQTGTTVYAGSRVTVTGRLFQTTGGKAVSGVLVDLLARTGGTTTVRKVVTLRTRPDGLVAYPLTQRVATEYQLRFAGDAFDTAAASPKAVVRVQPRINARFSPGAVLKGQGTTLLGTISPAYQGARVALQRKTGSGSFVTVLTAATASDGRYSAGVTLTATTTYRAVLVGTSAYNAAATAPLTVRVDPRDLRIGMRGADVLAVEQALWSQGRADVGRIDGIFDNDTRHGVIAFQKSQGLARTGVFQSVTRTRLAGHSQRAPRVAPTAARTVEIDLSQQVLRMYEKGRLVRLADVSTGNDENYVSDGVTYKAYTPIGRFSVQRKIDGIRVSRLGELYRPAYFTGGWAVHGSPSVPTYPASHGCVRVTNSQMDRLYPLLTIGVPVTVYAR